jgi:hypothetical protein
MPAEQIPACGRRADPMAHFIGNTPTSLADDGGFAPGYRQDGNKKEAQVMVHPLEIRLGLPAQGTQPWVVIELLGLGLKPRDEYHEVALVTSFLIISLFYEFSKREV